MKDDLEKLQDISKFLQRMNSKVKLLGLIRTAKAEYDKYDYESCYETLENAYKLDTKNSAILRGMGCLKQYKGDYVSAISFFKLALKYSTNPEIEYTLLGMVYYSQEKLTEAVEYFNIAIDYNDDYTPAYDGKNQAMLEEHVKILDLQESLKKYF